MRDPYFDNAKAILIILVVIGHILELFINNSRLIYAIYFFILSFHMPAFIIISGYFSKYVKNLTKAEIKYIFLYVTLSFTLWLFWRHIPLPYFMIFGHFTSWYLISLVFWYAFLPFMNKLKHPILLSFLFSLMIDCFDKIYQIPSIYRTFMYLPFFFIGYKLNEHSFNKIKNIIKPIYSIAIMLSFLIFLYFFNINNYETNYLFYRIVNYTKNIIMTICFFPLVPSNQNSFTWIGKHTLIIYLTHGILLLILQVIFFKYMQILNL